MTSTHLALARKYRPQNFLEVIGQDAIIKTLQNAIESNRLHHAYLFCGVRGVGKTSMARILAKSINCAKGPSITPCQECAPCRAITLGNSLDVIEIDGASNNSVENVRELRENVKYLPTEGQYKIIIIDEVHMLSGSAFNALLKTLEEPPAHVKFIFATTEAHDIPITILSRCQKYDFRKLNTPVLLAHLKKIAESEKIAIDTEALQLIARCSQGSVRDALSLMDQIFSIGTGADAKPVGEMTVRNLLGLSDRMMVQDCLNLILQADLPGALKELSEADERGLDLKLFAEDILAQYRHLILFESTGQIPTELSPAESDFFKSLKGRADLPLLLAQYQILFRTIQDLSYTEFQKTVLEIALVKLMQTQNMIGLADLVNSIKNRPAAPNTANTQRAATTVLANKPTTQDIQPIINTQNPASVAVSEVNTNTNTATNWYELVKWITREKAPLGGLLRDAVPVEFSENKIAVSLPATSRSFVIERVSTIQDMIQSHLGRKISFSVIESHIESHIESQNDRDAAADEKKKSPV